ncbi:MAG TPA: hypothetical protein VM557_04380 [Thermoanaerobaculia bacterium]|nr:hypothetical protein [Thermoanaerobaculia bacterium]
MRRQRSVARFSSGCLLVLIASAGCQAPPELTAQIAADVLKDSAFEVEPAYAEVPRVVSWSAESPKDDYDELAIRTLRNLERAGLVTLQETASSASYRLEAAVTRAGFPILGIVPSARGQALRARIAIKKVDGVENFVRHPTVPTVGRAEIRWHYEQPTQYYELFETKIDKPLGVPFATVISMRWDEGAWRFSILAPKVPVEPRG